MAHSPPEGAGAVLLFVLLLVAFVATHIAMVAPALRDPLVRRFGEKGFQGLYSLLSLLLLGGAVFLWRGMAPQPLWVAPGWAWLAGSALMLLASVLFVGSFTPANKGLAGAPQDDRPASGVLRITRHPMMWAFALWAFVHALLSGSLPTVLLMFSIGFLALVGAAHQDSRKRRRAGPAWQRYAATTSYWPGGAQISGRQPWRTFWPGLVPVVGGLLLWGLATFAHPMLGAPAVPPWGHAQERP